MVESRSIDELYDIVREKLAVGPLHAPKHEKILDLLKVFWDEDTIKVLAHFPRAGEVTSVQEIEDKSGLEKKYIRNMLKRATSKKTVSRVGRKYTLEPLVPGIFEAYFIAREDTAENLQRAAEAFRWIFDNVGKLEAAGQSMIDKDWSFLRPVLPLDSGEKLVEIGESVEARTQVLPHELVEDMINKNDYFAKIPCQCRLVGEKTGNPCTVAPAEMGCFVTGPGARAIAALEYGTPLSKEEALDYLRETEKAGLIHCTSNSRGGEHLMFICNCCSCHCGVVRPTKDHGFKTLASSNYQPQIKADSCVLCKTCVRKCPMEAITFQESPEQKIVIHPDQCCGCGVCAVNCKAKALALARVRDEIPPQTNKIGGKIFMETVKDLLTS